MGVNANVTKPSEDAEMLRHLKEIMSGVEVAMLTTQADDGELRCRPMATQAIGADGDLWFFTSDDSGKVHEIYNKRKVSLAYADPKNGRYVSLSGQARVSHDLAKIQDLWHASLKLWFPEGLDTRGLCLIHVTPERGEYWDTKSGKLTAAARVIRTLVHNVVSGDRQGLSSAFAGKEHHGDVKL